MKRQRPLVWIALAYSLGIAAMACSPILVGLIAAFCVTTFALNWATKREQWGWIALYCLVGVVGGLVYRGVSRIPAGDVSHLAPRTLTVFGIVDSDVEGLENPQAERLQKLRMMLNVQAVELEPGRIVPINGRISVRLPAPIEMQGIASQNPLPNYGDKVKIRGRLEIPDTPRNPGGMDYRAYLARQGIYSTMNIRRAADWQILHAANLGDPFTRLAYTLRDRIQSNPYHFLAPDRAGTLNGIILGTHNDLPGQLRDDFQRTGTAHILSASGMNVAFVIILSLWFFRLLPFTFRYANHLSIIAIVLYTLMANAQPSIVRAAVMGIIILFGIIIEREPDYPNTIALGALFLLVPHPQNLFDMGFQLSFAAIISLAVFAPQMKFVLAMSRKRFKGKSLMERTRRGTIEAIVLSLFATFFAQLGTAPLIAYYFSTFSLVGLFANGIVVPMIGFLMASGFLAVILAAIHPILAVPVYAVIGFVLSVLLAVVAFCSTLPFASINLPLNLFGVCVWYALVIALALHLRIKPTPKPLSEEVQIW